MSNPPASEGAVCEADVHSWPPNPAVGASCQCGAATWSLESRIAALEALNEELLRGSVAESEYRALLADRATVVAENERLKVDLSVKADAVKTWEQHCANRDARIEALTRALEPQRPTAKYQTAAEDRAYARGKYDARFRIDRGVDPGQPCRERQAYFDGLMQGARWEGEMQLAARAALSAPACPTCDGTRSKDIGGGDIVACPTCSAPASPPKSEDWSVWVPYVGPVGGFPSRVDAANYASVIPLAYVIDEPCAPAERDAATTVGQRWAIDHLRKIADQDEAYEKPLSIEEARRIVAALDATP